MRRSPKEVLFVACIIAAMGSVRAIVYPNMISAPYKPTEAFVGETVIFKWQYNSGDLKDDLYEVVFGIWKSPGFLKTKLIAVNSSGFSLTRSTHKSLVGWAGNLTSSIAVFELYNVKLEDGKVYGIVVEYGLKHTPLTDTVHLKVKSRPILNPPRITNISEPPPLRRGQNVNLICTAKSLSPVIVTWKRDDKVLVSGISEAILTLRNITAEHYGDYVSVAKNSDGEDTKTVSLQVLPESPTILNSERKVKRPHWTLRWSAIKSDEELVKYTVTQKQEGEESWLQKNVTGNILQIRLNDTTSYLFVVTAWNRCGESILDRAKIINISTDFEVRATLRSDISLATFSRESEAALTPFFSSRQKDESLWKMEFIILMALGVIFLMLSAIVVIRRKTTRDKETGQRSQELGNRGMTPPSNLHEHPAFDRAHDNSLDRELLTTEQVVTSLRFSESSLTIEKPVSVRGANTEEGTEDTPEISSIAAAYSSGQQVVSFTTFSSCEAAATPKVENENTIQVQEEATVIQRLDTFNRNRPPTDTTQGQNHSEDYLQPVEHLHLQHAYKNSDCGGKIKTLPRGRPVPKPGRKMSTFAGMTSTSQLCQGAQQRVGSERVNQSKFCTHHASALHQEHSYQNDTTAATLYESPRLPQSLLPSASGKESPYVKVQSNTNWEVPSERLRLFKRIGGGTFGQVWEGALLDVCGTPLWSVVAVKMLKGTCYCQHNNTIPTNPTRPSTALNSKPIGALANIL